MHDARELDLRIPIASDEERDELERALLKARAAELAEIRRWESRLTLGYGDAGGRETMAEAGRRARVRYDLLARVIDALPGREPG
jgi:hypothetical protein